MEPELKEYLRRLLFTISIVCTWFITNTAVGIKMGYAFWSEKFTMQNALFYLWLLFSIIIAFILIKKIWQKPIRFNN
ncbi:MAG: hypothetical protein LC134_06335 [Chitinophagales bacterium]|nr:hypothetical protein [Chitinophagales bacterium]